MGVVQANGHYDMPGAQIAPPPERLLQPELFQLYFAAFLNFLLPLAAFLVLFLISQSVAAVLELDLGAESPAATKVVT